MVLVISLMIGSECVAATQQKAAVSGTATANMRAGAGVEHALKAVLKEGDQVSVESSAGEWNQVVAADGQMGYVHRNLLKLVADATPQPTAPQPAPAKTKSPEAKEPSKDAASTAVPAAAALPPTTKSAPKPASIDPPKDPEPKSQSIMQMLEGHESEAKIGLLIAAIAFVLGWLCGGGYNARRERKSRHKLRF
jgi:hypothetical protein